MRISKEQQRKKNRRELLNSVGISSVGYPDYTLLTVLMSLFIGSNHYKG